MNRCRIRDSSVSGESGKATAATADGRRNSQRARSLSGPRISAADSGYRGRYAACMLIESPSLSAHTTNWRPWRIRKCSRSN